METQRRVSEAGRQGMHTSVLCYETPCIFQIRHALACCSTRCDVCVSYAYRVTCVCTQLVAVVKEWLPEELEAFQTKFWPSEELFLDEDWTMFKALNNGEPLRLALSSLANPFRCTPLLVLSTCQSS